MCEHMSGDRFQNAADLARVERIPVHVVLDNLRSAFNVGSILRTSEAARVSRVHLCGITARPPNPKLAKTSLRASRFVPWVHHDRTRDALAGLREAGVTIAALEVTPSSRSYLEVEHRFPVAIVLGHEVRGVDPELLPLTDHVIRIPMGGVKSSLNVATSCGIVLFDLVRRLGPPMRAAARGCTS